MQPIRSHIAVAGLCWLLSLYGCSNLPDRAPALTSPAGLDPARQAVVASARHMLGKPYRFGGNSPRGFDCSGLVWYAHRHAGISVPRTARSQRSAANPVSVAQLNPGDLLFFRIGRGSDHVGIYIGEGKFIHAPSAGKGVATARLSEPYWSSRLSSAGHFFRPQPRASLP